MRLFLSVFPIDRRDIARHAATIRGHFATRHQREDALLFAAALAASLANVVAACVIFGGGQ